MQAENASEMEERGAALEKLACACNELAVFDFVFYLDNPCHYNDEQSWLVMPQGRAHSKHTAMTKGAVNFLLLSRVTATLAMCEAGRAPSI